MNVVAITAEYLLAGLLILCIFAAPFIGDPSMLLQSSELWFVVAGIAYLLGVVADRVAEHILEPVGSHETLQRVGLLDQKRAVPDDDPLPLDKLTLEVRRRGQGLLEWHDQLRGRLRVTRNLVVYGHWAIAAIGVLATTDSGTGALPIVASVAIGLQVWSASTINVEKTNEFVATPKHEIAQLRERLANDNRAIWTWWILTGPVAVGGVLWWYMWQDPSRMVVFWWLAVASWAASSHAWRRIHRTFISFMLSCLDLESEAKE
ncbi:hypothetical protein ACNOYE_28715 [Nannocystaceae bacterium ST9]